MSLDKIADCSTDGQRSLNVGGRYFTTTESTLTKFGNHYLSQIIQEAKWCDGDQGDPIFIDRNPNVFGHILDFLRKGRLNLRNEGPWLRDLLDEAEFYDILPLISTVRTELGRFEAKELEDEIVRKTVTESPMTTTAIYINNGTSKMPIQKSSHHQDSIYRESNRVSSPAASPLSRFPSIDPTLRNFSWQRRQPLPQPPPILSREELEHRQYRLSLVNDANTPPSTPRESHDLGEPQFTIDEDF